MTALRLLALVLLLVAGGGLHAQEPLPVPALSARVIDQTGTLAPLDREALESRLASVEAQAGPQIVGLIVPSTAPEDIASYAQRVGEAWKIGRREVGDGLLLVVAKDDRRLWIATSKALEGAIPDLAARQVIQNTLSPAFKRGDYAGGLAAGVDELMARIRGEGLPAPGGASQRGPTAAYGLDLESLLIFFFVGVPIIGSALTGIFGRRLGSLLSSAGAGAFGWVFTSSWLLAGVAGAVALVVVGILGIGATRQRLGRVRRGRSDPVIWSGGTGGWGGGSTGGWGGGGGFRSGGGGDFGGGGAGGDW